MSFCSFRVILKYFASFIMQRLPCFVKKSENGLLIIYSTVCFEKKDNLGEGISKLTWYVYVCMCVVY